jgi:hypothetical protein
MRDSLSPWRVAAFAACALAAVSSSAADGAARPLFREGEIIVKFRGRVGVATMTATASRVSQGASLARTMAVAGRTTTGLVRFGKGESVEAMVARFKAVPEVEYAEPNYIAYTDPIRGRRDPLEKRALRGTDGRATIDSTATRDPIRAALMERQVLELVNDPLTNNNDAWFWIDAHMIWPDPKPNPMIAVIDTGVDYTHPDLATRVVKGRDWVNADVDPMDDNGHGTHVAGIAAANVNNLIGITGVSKAQVFAIKVLNVTGSGTYYDIAGGIIDASNNAAVRVINLSLGGTGSSTLLQDAVTYAVSRGKLLVIAAGNANTNTPSYPAYYARAASFPTLAPQIISVGATGLATFEAGTPVMNYGCEASYSNYGDWVTFVAPGTDIFSTTPTKPFFANYYEGVEPYYDFLSGTSMAAPMVAGAASRVFTSMPPGATAAQVKGQLEATGTLDVALGHVDVDTDDDSVGDTACWPSGAGFTTDTVSALNVAAAMNRSGVAGRTWNANGRLPLPGALHQVQNGAVIAQFGGDIPANTLNATYWYLLNVPMNIVTPYNVRVSKPGYTLGFQTVNQVTVGTCGGGHETALCVGFYDGGEVSVPPIAAGVWQVVTDFDATTAELDQYAFTPSTAPILCSVGFYNGITGDCGTGQLQTHPYMRYMLDSFFAGGTEFTSVRPFYPTTTISKYRVLVTDYAHNANTILAGTKATARFWLGGVVRATVKGSAGDGVTNNCDNVGGANDCRFWHVADLTATTVTVVNKYGTAATGGTGVFPYSRRDDIATKSGSALVGEKP